MSLESIAIAKLMAQKNTHLGPNTLDVAQEYVAPHCLLLPLMTSDYLG